MRPRAPQDLRSEAKRLWRDIVAQWEFSPDALAVLKIMVWAFGSYLDAKEILDQEGRTFKTTSGQIKKHPMVEIEKTSRAAFLQAVKQLDLQEEEKDQRLKRGPGRQPKRHKNVFNKKFEDYLD